MLALQVLGAAGWAQPVADAKLLGAVLDLRLGEDPMEPVSDRSVGADEVGLVNGNREQAVLLHRLGDAAIGNRGLGDLGRGEGGGASGRDSRSGG